MNPIGHKFHVDFGMAKAILHIRDEQTLTFTITEKNGETSGISETVSIKLTALRPSLFLFTWQEHSGTTVTQIHDYENQAIYSNWTDSAGDFTNLRGSLKPL